MKKLLLLPFLLLLSIVSGAQCVAGFTSAAAPTNNNLLRWSFLNTSTYSTVGTYAYNNSSIYYGDGSFSVYAGLGGNTLYHTYSAPGNYSVQLIITRTDSITNTLICTDTITHVINVAYSACATSIAASAGYNGAQTFTATTPAGTTGMTYSWSFGDGTTGSGSPVSHTYASNGYYTVTLVASGGGCSYTNTYTLYVTNVQANCSNLHALFTSSVAQNIVSLFNGSTYYAGLTKVSTWTYGDGTSGNSNSHTYAAVGTYTVKLKVQWLDSVTQALVCQDSITHTVTIANVVNYIQGLVSFDSTGLYGQQLSFKVWLITFDSLSNSLTAIDSQTITSPSWAFYYFSGKPAGSYLVKAMMLNQTTGATGAMPTYHDSSLYWNSAQIIYHPGTGITGANIKLKQGTVTAGPGFVGGNVSLGANKGASAGVSGINVFLLDAANKAIASATTDANGDFSFSNIPIGTYSVYPEHLNYATTAMTNVTVSSTIPSVIDANFNQDNTKMNIKPFGLSVSSPKGLDKTLNVYPNPASKSVNVSWKGANAIGAHLIITNTSGQVVIDESITNTSSSYKSININTLTPGVYFLRGTAGLQGQVQKLIVE